MANWKTILDLSDIRAEYEDEKITLQVLAYKTAARLRLNPFAQDDQLQYIIQEFQELSQDNIVDDDYDDILNDLYEFADQEHRIWIKMSVPNKNRGDTLRSTQ